MDTTKAQLVVCGDLRVSRRTSAAARAPRFFNRAALEGSQLIGVPFHGESGTGQEQAAQHCT